MSHHNQHTTKQPRKQKLPLIAVTADERRVAERVAADNHISLAQLVRAAMVVAGVFEVESLGDLPPSLAARLLKERRIPVQD